jgi:hypothetical protein
MGEASRPGLDGVAILNHNYCGFEVLHNQERRKETCFLVN